MGSLLLLSGCASDLCGVIGIFGGESDRAACRTPTVKVLTLHPDLSGVQPVMPIEKAPYPPGSRKALLWELNRAVGLPPP